ncbi:GNAT family N-acetyltransferase [Leptolyngbya sp. FACHB-711]|uniref:GNAT family N-acetyltransferase n=1 Tax=unclassified Leptolyngbya TaxID=2650499 RepID=UPI0016867F45|nr:GNAT family N-acetyltransferase [Leptolyngbya sp. FACHB-711]MBD1848442.1 GNAT family N-acetyltransferase [Cyanobacteria bacterium FACHB-502]MBD2024162.1 GNAT family N-acetyltransferase [Leptolyngbya sp. FACHB-711]
MELETTHLRLVLQSTEEILAQIETMSPADQAEVSLGWLAQLRAASSANPWTHGFAIVLKTSGAVIGSCGYKGPPNSDRVVEIAYGVDADHQGRGYATEAAAALTRYALESSRVRLVCAHTRPEENASTRVLTKCGFRWAGEVNDPEDGLVWRWERTSGVT